MQTTAVIDVDGVLYDYVTHLAHVASKVTNRPLEHFPPALVWDFFKEQWGMTTAEYLELVDIGLASHGFIAQGEPFAHAKQGFDLLNANGVHIHIATHMGTDGDANGARAARTAWLSAHGLDYAELTFTPDKAAVARLHLDQGQRVFALEDNVENYQALATTGASAYLLDQAWNRSCPAPRVTNVLEFAHQVLGN